VSERLELSGDQVLAQILNAADLPIDEALDRVLTHPAAWPEDE